MAIWFVSAVTFASVIKREYLNTFYSMDTASTYNRKRFLALREDQELEKSEILPMHPDIYAKWGDTLLKSWTLGNWSRWEVEKPAWFTSKWIEAVPNEHVPYDFRVKYKKTKGKVSNLKRRSSLQQVKAMLGEEEER